MITLGHIRSAVLIETMFSEQFRSQSLPSWTIREKQKPKSRSVSEIEREWMRFKQIEKERQVERDQNRRDGIVKILKPGRAELD